MPKMRPRLAKDGLTRPLTRTERVVFDLDGFSPQLKPPLGPESDQRAWEQWQRVRDQQTRRYIEQYGADCRPNAFWFFDHPEIHDQRRPGESDQSLLRRFGLLSRAERAALGVRNQPKGKLLAFTKDKT